MIRYSSTFSYEFPFRFTFRLWSSFSLFGSWSFFFSLNLQKIMIFFFVILPNFAMNFHFVLLSDYYLFPFLDLDRLFSLILPLFLWIFFSVGFWWYFSLNSRRNLRSLFFFNLILFGIIRYFSKFSYGFPFRFAFRLWFFSLFGSWSFYFSHSSKHHLFPFSGLDRFLFSLLERLWSFFLFGFWSFFFFTFQKIMILFLFRNLIVFVFFLWSSKYDKKFLGSKFYSHFVWDSTSKIFRYWETCILFKYICRVMWLRKIIKSNIYLDG